MDRGALLTLSQYDGAWAIPTQLLNRVGVSTCGSGCLRGPVPASECPGDPGAFRNCDSVSVGSYCEGDGECGTDAGADNCDSYDVYQIVDNGEAVLSTSTESVAAARVFDRPRGEPGAALVGAAVVEQYGYN